MPRPQQHHEPALHIRQVGLYRWQARPYCRDGRGRVNLGSYYTREAALTAVRMYKDGKINARPKYVMLNPRGPGFIVHVRGDGYSVRLKMVFDTEVEAEMAVKDFFKGIDKTWKKYMSDQSRIKVLR